MTLPPEFLKRAVSQPLSAMGFGRAGRRNVWLRQADGIHHAVSLEQSRGSWKVRWDVVEPSVGQVLHGRLVPQADVAYSGIITGLSQPALGPGVVATFTQAELDADALVNGVGLAADQVVGWLDDFPDVQSVIGYLTGDLKAGIRASQCRPTRLYGS